MAIDVPVGLDGTATAVDLPRKGGGSDVGTAGGNVDRIGEAVAVLAAEEVDVGRVGHGGGGEAYGENLIMSCLVSNIGFERPCILGSRWY